MIHGFIKTAAVTPKVQVADPEGNAREIIRLAKEAAGNGAKIIVFPELCITGYTCGDLFLQELLLEFADAADVENIGDYIRLYSDTGHPRGLALLKRLRREVT